MNKIKVGIVGCGFVGNAPQKALLSEGSRAGHGPSARALARSDRKGPRA